MFLLVKLALQLMSRHGFCKSISPSSVVNINSSKFNIFGVVCIGIEDVLIYSLL